MSSDDQRDVFCDALGSGRDNDSFDGDAVETVIDEDEFGYGRGKSFEARRVVSEPVTNSDSSSTALPPIAGRFMRSDALSKPSTSESEIFLPVISTFPGRYGTQPELPQPPMDERGRYSAYSSVASPMFGAFGPGADRKSTDPLLLRGKASTGIETVDVRSADMQVFQQRRTSAGMAEKGEILGKTAVEENKLKWALVGNLFVLWISFVSFEQNLTSGMSRLTLFTGLDFARSHRGLSHATVCDGSILGFHHTSRAGALCDLRCCGLAAHDILLREGRGNQPLTPFDAATSFLGRCTDFGEAARQQGSRGVPPEPAEVAQRTGASTAIHKLWIFRQRPEGKACSDTSRRVYFFRSAAVQEDNGATVKRNLARDRTGETVFRQIR